MKKRKKLLAVAVAALLSASQLATGTTVYASTTSGAENTEMNNNCQA